MPFTFPRCEALPLPDHQISFRVAGTERLRWHFGPSYPRPFFFPLVGPSGIPLTRMGHPGAPDHDHHRSVWFAHQKVSGVDFWTERTTAKVRQKQWLCLKDGPDETLAGFLLGWYDGHDPKELMEQELLVAVRPGADGETFVELQSTFKPTAETLEFGKTNFGFLAVRVAKHLSAHFGGGVLTNSAGKTDEVNLFAQAAQWVDYSGPTPKGEHEGITYFDHPTNPGHPNKWHVREDGWMSSAPCLDGPLETTKKKPLKLRYLLQAHTGKSSADKANKVALEFAKAKALLVVKANVKHQSWDIIRES